MSRRLASIGAVIRKDVLAFWPLITATIFVLLMKAWYNDLGALNTMLPGPVVGTGGIVLSAILAVAIVHSDPAASVRHDWLTRPVRGFDMALAKCLLLLVAVALPWVIGDLVKLLLDDRLPLGEALLAVSGSAPAYAAEFLLLLSVAGVTASKGQALGMTLALFAVLAGVMTLQAVLNTDGNAIVVGGVTIAPIVIIAACAVAYVLVLRLQYVRRATLPARLALGGVMALAAAGSWLIPPRSAEAGEAAEQMAARVKVTGLSACLTDDPSTEHWSEDEHKAAGPNPKAILATTRIDGLPEGWLVVTDRLEGTYAGGGRAGTLLGGSAFGSVPGPNELPSPPPPPETGSRNQVTVSVGVRLGTPPAAALPELGRDVFQSDWLIPGRDAPSAAARDAAVRLEASVTVLKPAAEYRIPGDGRRYEIPGLGYCGTRTQPEPMGKVLDCRVVRSPAAMAIARAAREPAACRINCGTLNHMPAWTMAVVSRQSNLRLGELRPDDHVVLTMYEIAGRLRREVAFTGPRPACPRRQA